MKIEPNTICRIVGTRTNDNRLVRAVQKCPCCTEWSCEALQTLDGYSAFYVFGVPTMVRDYRISPGQFVDIPAENLRPLYDGDADEEWVIASRLVGSLA